MSNRELKKLLTEFKENLVEIQGLTEEGYVLGWKNNALFQSTVGELVVLGLAKAKIYSETTSFQLTNGHNERADWMTMKKAKKIAEANLTNVIEMLEAKI